MLGERSVTGCSPSSISLPSSGITSGRPTPSKVSLPPSVTARSEPREPSRRATAKLMVFKLIMTAAKNMAKTEAR